MFIAAQSIGEPGTQLTLRTFHVGGTAGNISSQNSIIAKYDGIAEIEELRTVPTKDETDKDIDIVIGRLAELRIIDKNTGIALANHPISYGSKLYIKNGAEVKAGDLISEWDPYNAVIVSEKAGIVSFDNMLDGVTYKEESDEQTGFREKVIIETRDKTKKPCIKSS